MKSVHTYAPPDGGYGWVIILACVIINSSHTPLMQCFGIIYENKFVEMNISATKISFLLHLHNSVMCSLGLLSGPLLKKYNFRQMAVLGSVFVCSGTILTALAESYAYLIVTLSISIGVGLGILMPSTSLAINTYFKKNLTLAMSLSVTGVGLLPIAMPQICNWLLDLYGVKGTVLIFGGISLHCLVGALLLRPLIGKRKTSTLTNGPKTQEPTNEDRLLPSAVGVYNETTTPTKIEPKQNRLNKLYSMFNLGLFKERVYVIIVIGMGISYVAELNFVLMTPFVLSELASFTRADVALAMSIQAAADISGRLAIPLWAYKQKWPPKVMYASALIGSCIGRTALTIFCDTRYIVLTCAVLLGLSKGAKAVFQSLILPKYVSLENLPAAMGFLMVINGVLSLAIGPLIGFIHDVNNSYTYALHTATVMSLFCVFLWATDSSRENHKFKAAPAVDV